MNGVYLKDPGDFTDFGLDWGAWLTEGDSIATATWDIPEGLTGGDSGISGTITYVWLSGGTAGRVYVVTCHIETLAEREGDAGLMIRVLEREG